MVSLSVVCTFVSSYFYAFYLLDRIALNSRATGTVISLHQIEKKRMK